MGRYSIIFSFLLISVFLVFKCTLQEENCCRELSNSTVLLTYSLDSLLSFFHPFSLSCSFSSLYPTSSFSSLSSLLCLLSFPFSSTLSFLNSFNSYPLFFLSALPFLSFCFPLFVLFPLSLLFFFHSLSIYILYYFLFLL